MTPKEKALELVAKFSEYSEFETNEWGDITISTKYSSKKCAFICVDEILDANPTKLEIYNTYADILSTNEYWLEVKNEIEKL